MSVIIEYFTDNRKVRFIDDYVIKSFSGTKRGGVYGDLPDGSKDIKCGVNLCTSRSKNAGSFENEAKILTILNKYKYFPKIYNIDHDILEIKMENVSNNSALPDNWREQIDEIYDIFRKEQIIPYDLLNVFHCTIKDSTFKIIDLERYRLLNTLSKEDFEKNKESSYLEKSKKSLTSNIMEINKIVEKYTN